MKKILILSSILASLAFAEVSTEDKQKSAEYFNLENSKSFFVELEKDYFKSTGDDKFQLYLEKAVKNEDWRLANYYFLYKLKSFSSLVSGEKKNYKLQDYQTALFHFKKAVEKTGDVLSAYQGFRILEKYFFYVKKDNSVVQEFLPTFSKVLYNKNYCLGHLYYARTFTKEYSSSSNYQRAADILKEGKKQCLEGEHSFYKRGINHEYAKIKTILRIKG